VYPKPTLLTLMVIFTLTLLAFFISLSMQMMNQLFLGQSMGVAIAAVILPLVLSLILSLIAFLCASILPQDILTHFPLLAKLAILAGIGGTHAVRTHDTL